MNSQIPLQLIPITDPEEVQRLEYLIQDIIDKPGHLNINWLINKGGHFDESDAETILQAIQAIGCENCFAVATEPLMDFLIVFESL